MRTVTASYKRTFSPLSGKYFYKHNNCKTHLQKYNHEEKPNQKSKIKISEDKLRSAIPKSVRVDNYEDFIFKAIDYYSKHLEKAKSYER